jgi:hypothetical protein
MHAHATQDDRRENGIEKKNLSKFSPKSFLSRLHDIILCTVHTYTHTFTDTQTGNADGRAPKAAFREHGRWSFFFLCCSPSSS